ncbi:MAG TPA: DUF5615 family PIN-like protein [Pirellulaceae bacterium]|jgi:predicted nuclease of predicted toxin-antitoxin system
MADSSSDSGLFVRLYLDRHIHTRLAEDLVERGFDCLTTQEARLDTASDEEQLAFAASQSRAILTFNIRDFAPLHEQWTASGRLHSGIIVSRQLGSRQYGLLLARILRLLDGFTRDEMAGSFIHLEQFKE